MKKTDKILQSWRIREASKYLRQGSRVLDIGSFDGSLFKQLRAKSIHGVGIEPLIKETLVGENFKIIPGSFPDVVPDDCDFDAITMLAVFEHILPPNQSDLLKACYEHLVPNGYLIITVPSKMVDVILDILIFLHLIDGMSTHEHYGFKPKDTIIIAEREGFILKKHRLFQLGLNNLFVFEKSNNIPNHEK